MVSQGERRYLVHDEIMPIEMDPRFYEFPTLFRGGNRYETILTTVALHLITYDFTDIFDFIEVKGFGVLIVDVHEKVVKGCLLFDDVKFLSAFDRFHVPLVKVVQFIKWHGEDTTVHEHM
jgi:hypothetical protein